MFLKPVNDLEVIRYIKQLKNSHCTVCDFFSNALLKQASEFIIKPLVFTINLCFTSGVFPDKLKIAKVIPLFKAGNPQLVSNYRPISLLPSVSKLFEKAIYNRIYNYFSKNICFKTSVWFSKKRFYSSSNYQFNESNFESS